MRRQRLAALVLGLLLSVGTASWAQRIRSNATLITAEQMRDYLTFVASDEMEGRDTPSHGLETTALFISTLLKRWGVKPAGDDGSFFQRITLRRDIADPEKSRLQLGAQNFVFGEDLLLDSFRHRAEASDLTLSAPLVYVGDGWMIKNKNIDDYQGIDAKGKIVVVNDTDGYSPPRGLSYADLKGKPGTDWVRPDEYARLKGAVGMLILPSQSRVWANELWQDRRRFAPRDAWYPEKLASIPGSGVSAVGSSAGVDLPMFRISQRLTVALMAGEKVDAKALADREADTTRLATALPAFELRPEKQVTVTLTAKTERTTTSNILALVEGSDPVLKNEYVALGCHYDHIGMYDRSAPGDIIFNGADDNGSGTVALMAMAEAFSRTKKRPKRSTLFVWHTGEEHGMWGSEYFTSFPTVPLSHIVTEINLDMIGRSRTATDMRAVEQGTSGTNEIYLGDQQELSSELGPLVEKVNAGYLKLHLNYNTASISGSSDHVSYLKQGIPVLYFLDGMDNMGVGDYHGVGDETQKIDFPKMERVTRTVYEILWTITNLNKRPAIDKPLPEGLSGN